MDPGWQGSSRPTAVGGCLLLSWRIISIGGVFLLRRTSPFRLPCGPWEESKYVKVSVIPIGSDCPEKGLAAQGGVFPRVAELSGIGADDGNTLVPWLMPYYTSLSMHWHLLWVKLTTRTAPRGGMMWSFPNWKEMPSEKYQPVPVSVLYKGIALGLIFTNLTYSSRISMSVSVGGWYIISSNTTG